MVLDSVRNGCASTNGVVRPADSGATHQTSIGGSAEVISRSRRLSEKAREFMELASLRCFSLRQAVGSRGRGDSDSPRNSSVPHRLAIQKDWLTTDRVQLGFTQGEGVAVQNSQVHRLQDRNDNRSAASRQSNAGGSRPVAHGSGKNEIIRGGCLRSNGQSCFQKVLASKCPSSASS